MKSNTKIILLSCFYLLVSTAIGQNFNFKATNYIFSSDSLAGFDEDASRKSAMAIRVFGEEYKMYMYYAKREFINTKYNLSDKSIITTNQNAQTTNKGTSITSSSCVNSDFEEASLMTANPGTLIVGNSFAVNGWTINSGYNSGTGGSCSLASSFAGQPNACKVINTNSVTGSVDAIIGSSYPLYSVFGDNLNSGNSISGNPSVMRGNWLIQLNDQNPGAGAHKLSKCVFVTPNTAIFSYAIMTVVQESHCCCDNAGVAVKIKSGFSCGMGTYTSCPTYTTSAPSLTTGCTPTGTCGAGPATTYYNASTPGWYYTKWKINTIDLSQYIGQSVTIDVFAFDCPYGSHAGYAYFDAQCNPFTFIVNGNPISATTSQTTVPTCGSGSTATISAPSGMGPYLWSGPDPLVNGSTAQTFTTMITGNYTVTMNPPGSCMPSIKQVSLVISPSPNIAILNTTQASCTNSLNGTAIIMSSGTPNTTLTPNYYVSFLPAQPTATIGNSAQTGTYTGMTIGSNTITITDALGCSVSQTIMMNPPPPISGFSISALGGTLIGCNPSTATLTTINTTTLSNMTYTWSSASTGSFVGNPWLVGAPTGTNIITVTGRDLTIGSCQATHTIAVIQNTIAPSVTVSPTSRTLTCNGPPVTFTAITTGSLNLIGSWYDSSGTLVSGTGATPVVLSTASPGTYTALYTNTTNGCSASQTVAVVSNTAVPTMTVNSPNGYTITCNNPYLSMSAQGSAGPAPFTYTWTNLTTSVSITPASGNYTITTPGQYVARFMNGNSCQVSKTITVLIDSVRPIVSSITSLPGNSYTLNCYSSAITASAITNPLLPASNYSWTIPPNFTVNQNTVNVSFANFTGTNTISSYTVLAMGANGCVGRSKINFYKNSFVPPYTIAFTPNAITCTNSCIYMSPGPSSYTIPITFTFTSPAPTATSNVPGFMFCTPGTYTMTYQNTLNGCTATTTTLVPLNVTPPSTVALAPIQLQCGYSTVTLTAGTTTTSPSYSYSWEGPTGTAMSCPAGVGCYSTTATLPGTYNVYISNSINGCSALNTVSVLPPTFPVGFYATPNVGCSAPLTIFCANLTPSTNSSGTITTNWNFGDGHSITTTSAATTYTGSSTPFPGGTNTYTASGNYVITLTMTQYYGSSSCTGNYTSSIQVGTGILPTVSITGNSVICAGESSTLTANGSNLTYTWSSGAFTSSVILTPTATTVYTLTIRDTITTCQNQINFTVTVNPCVGIKELKSENEFVKILPNPNSGVFGLSVHSLLPGLNFEMYDLTGKKILSIPVKSGTNHIESGNLAKGIYRYQLISEKEMLTTGKIIIE